MRCSDLQNVMARKTLTSLLPLGGILAAAFLVTPPLAAQEPKAGPEKLGSSQERPRPAAIQSPEQLRDADHEEDDLLFPLKRNLWFEHLRAFPNPHIPVGAYWRSQVQRQALIARYSAMLQGLRPDVAANVASLSSVKWTPDGPQPTAAYYGSVAYSGRATSIAVVPSDPSTIYLGTAAGGVWKTTNAGQTWLPVSDSQASLAIGAVAVDPNNPNNVFAGTGEPDFSGDSYYGQGLLKSTNAGQTWTLIRSPFTTGDTAPDFAAIAVQPGNSEVVLAGNQAGLYRSADGGTTWTVVINSGVSALLFDVKNHSTVYAGAGGFGLSAGPLLKSTDAGVTWKPLNGTGANIVPALSAVLRTSITEDVTGANLFVAFARSDFGSPGSVFHSTDGGANWTQLASPSALDWYRNAIAVVPNNPKVLYATGAGLYESVDGGATWNAVGGQAYADEHAFAFTPDGKTMYLTDDGGVFVNTNPAAASANFVSLNTTINTLTFYPHFSILAGKPKSMLGGSQDHGLNLYLGELAWPNGEQSGFCGDGNGVYIDPKGEYAYAHCQGGSANWAVNPTGDASTNSWVAGQTGIDVSDRTGWVADIEGDQKNLSIVYTGTYRLYRSTNNAADWTAISPDLTYGNGVISTIAVSPSDSNTVYVGSDDGKISVTNNATAGAAATWKTLAGLPQLSVSKIVVQPDSDNDVYMTLYGFGADHVYHSTNGGASWQNISGDLPDTPADSILVDPDIPTTIYLATDIGVYVTTNGGTNWVPLGTGLPNVVVQDILMYHPTRTLRVVTHGRGAWDAVLNQIIPVSLTVNPATIDSPATATITVTLNLPAPTGGATIALAPTNSTAFPIPASVTIPANSTSATLTVTASKITSPQSLTIAASYNGATVKSLVTLNPGSLALSANTSSQTVAQGKSISFSLKVQSLNNFDGKVTFSAANLPTGYLATGTGFNPATVTPAANGSATSTFTLATSAKTIPGAYTSSLEASSPGYATQVLPVKIQVVEAPAPTISSFSPATLPASAAVQTLKIIGTNYLAGDTLTFTPPGGLSFLSSAADLTVVSATEISYQFNDGSTPGKWSVVVNSPDGTTHSAAGSFTVTSTVNNPIPAIKSFSPTSIPVEAPPQSLTLEGTGFLYSSAVTFNGTAHPATYVSPTALKISLGATDLATVGNYAVIVTNPAPGGGPSPATKFPVTFGPWTWYDGSSTPNLHGVEGKQGTPSTANFPGARADGNTWTDTAGNFWLFGGLGYDAGTYYTTMNDLWEFVPSNKTWNWVTGGATGVFYGTYGQQGTPSTGNTPGSRNNSTNWIDKSGNFWLFGGGAWDAGSGFGPMDDLWEFKPSAKTWEWVSGSAYNSPSGTYGTKGAAAKTNAPGGRQNPVSWVDSSGNFWIFGGQGLDASAISGYLNDLWEFSPTTGTWNWISGANAVGSTNSGAKGIYGTKGVASTANTPGGRTQSSTWTDSSGNFWLFGGNGFDSAGVFGDLNDLWEFIPSTKTWTWISGSSTITPANTGPKGVYGTQGVAAAANTPGGRYGSLSWTDSTGKHWLFGGYGFDVNGYLGYLDDLWLFNSTTKTWTWMSGSRSGNPAAVYGTLGVGSVNNDPGGRSGSVGWADKNGDLWLFGGGSQNGYLSDVWRFVP